MVEVFGKNHGSSEYGTGERAPSGLIAPGLHKALMQIIQQMCFLLHAAKLHNLSFLVKPFLQHGNDFVLAGDDLLVGFHEILKVTDPPFQNVNSVGIFCLHLP